MAGKVLEYKFMIDDLFGNKQPGKTTHCYPHNTLANDGAITDNGDGTYTVILDYVTAGNDNIISRRYDIYDGATKKMNRVPIGVAWQWIIDVAVNTNPKVVVFNGLVDALDGLSLPTTIPNAVIEILYPAKGRSFYFTAVSSTGFTIGAQLAGDDNAKLPVTVRLRVTVGES